MITHAMLNGHLSRAEALSLHVSDLSILRGYGIFDFFLFLKGQPLFLEDYLDRFYRSARLLHLEIPFTREAFASQIFELIEANGYQEGGIRLLLTGGYSPDGYTPSEPNVLILQYPLPAQAWDTTATLKLITHPHLRELPEIKTTNYITGISLLPELKKHGADDLLYLDGEWIRESVRSNFFLVLEGDRVVTPAQKILLGVTRKQVLHLARQRYTVEEREVHVSEIAKAKEAFFTSSTKGIFPVIQIDGRPVGDGKPGPVSKQLQQDFIAHLEAYLQEKLTVTAS